MAQTMFPALRYKDAKKAIRWLCEAFGFEKLAVYETAQYVEHAELRYGDSVLMLGSIREGTSLEIMSPAQAGGVTAAIYVCVPDADAHFARATAAGAEIVRPLTDQEYGSRDYSCRDVEGNLWSFGTYRPSLEAART